MTPKSRIPLKKRLSVDAVGAYNKVLTAAFTSLTHPDLPVLLGHLRARNYKRLLEWAESRHTEVNDATQYYVETQLVALIKKYPFTNAEIPGLDPEGAARVKYLAAEHRCKRVNQIRTLQRNRWDDSMSFWEMARSYIVSVIGYEPDLEEIYSECNFTGGASLGVHGNATNQMRKLLADDWTVTPSALRYAVPALWTNIHARDVILPGDVKCYDELLFEQLVRERVKLVCNNNIAYVPKTAVVHRTMTVEPLLNGYLQKGIDRVMRRLLLRRGLDLSDQSKNARMAFKGSLGGFNPYVTLDLSAASDTISIEVVRDLLPPAWFDLLNDIRTKFYKMPGDDKLHRFHKFCSMGNGFCFPLETLIFASISYAASAVSSLTNPYDFRVYGDDIIVRQSSALLLTELLHKMGFRLNSDKSFITGPFRESCGSDWLRGQDVRPVYLKSRLTDVREVMAFHNSTLRSPRVELALDCVRTALRKLPDPGVRFMRPGREPGDTCFSVPLDVAMNCPTVRWEKVKQCWSWAEIASKPVKDHYCGPLMGAYPFALYYSFMSGSDSQMLAVLRYLTKPKRVVVSRWFSNEYAAVTVPGTREDVLGWLDSISRMPYRWWHAQRRSKASKFDS